MRMASSIWVNWAEFFTWCIVFPVSGLSSPAKCLDSWYVGAPMLLTMGLRGTSALCILGSPYSLGGLDPDGLSFLQISSESVDFLSSFVVLRSVGSLVSLLYAESSSRV